MEPLGGKRLSELKAGMLELCPCSEEALLFFCYLFLQRLPCEIQELPSDENSANMRAIPQKADRLMVLHSSQSYMITVATFTAATPA
jgi:hypothetical protein